MRRLRLLHLSDTHVLREGALHLGRVDTRAQLRAALTRFDALRDLDAVVVSGDCSDDGTEDSYRFLADTVGGFAAARGAATVYAVGNHDDRATFARILGNGVGGAAPAPHGGQASAVDAVLDVAGYRLIVLDTQVPGQGDGAIDPARVEHAAAALREAGRPAVVVLHHPPVPATDRLTHVFELDAPERLLPLVGTGLVRAFLCGHYHHALSASFHGVPVHVAPGVANVVDTASGYDEYVTRPGWGGQVVDVEERGVTVLPVVAEGAGAPATLPQESMLRIARADGGPHWRRRWDDGAP